MGTVWRVARVAFLTIGVLAGAGRGCGASGQAGQRPLRPVTDSPAVAGQVPKLTVRVYNYARLDRASLIRAEQVATEILMASGLETAWVDCPLSLAEFETHRACQSNATPTDIDMKILPRSMAEKLKMSTEPLGFVRPCSDSDPACEITIFDYTLEEMAKDGYRTDAILGHAIAHEMAHVLIGGAHSEAGIMRAVWSQPELQKMSLGVLLCFSDEQSEALRAAAQRRETARESMNEEASVGRVDLSGGAK